MEEDEAGYLDMLQTGWEDVHGLLFCAVGTDFEVGQKLPSNSR